MFGLRKTLSTLILICLFVVLALLSVNIYNEDKGESEVVLKEEPFSENKTELASMFNSSLDMARKNMETIKIFLKKTSGLTNKFLSNSN